MIVGELLDRELACADRLVHIWFVVYERQVLQILLQLLGFLLLDSVLDSRVLQHILDVNRALRSINNLACVLLVFDTDGSILPVRKRSRKVVRLLVRSPSQLKGQRLELV